MDQNEKEAPRKPQKLQRSPKGASEKLQRSSEPTGKPQRSPRNRNQYKFQYKPAGGKKEELEQEEEEKDEVE